MAERVRPIGGFVSPAEKALFEVACVAADTVGMFDDVKAACIARGLFINSGRPTNDYTDGEDLSPLGRRAWLAAVEAFCRTS